jgi:CRP-like cAMP-binding protein
MVLKSFGRLSVLPVSNDLMAQLTTSDQQLLLKNTRFVELKVGDILVSPIAADPLVYFLTSGAVALYLAHKPGQLDEGLAVGLVGREGALGLQAALGMGVGNLTLIVQTHGYAHVLEAQRLRLLMKRHPNWLMIFSRHLWQLFQDIARLAALTQVHDVKQRLADWLLMSELRRGEEPLIMTHAHIARMLGVRRASITLAARQMKLLGLIHYSRGYIQLLDIPALQTLAAP